MAANGMIPASVYQFRAKNFYGMKDEQEIKLAPKTDLTPENENEILEQIPDKLETDVREINGRHRSNKCSLQNKCS